VEDHRRVAQPRRAVARANGQPDVVAEGAESLPASVEEEGIDRFDTPELKGLRKVTPSADAVSDPEQRWGPSGGTRRPIARR
jgi:hypothetical protein